MTKLEARLLDIRTLLAQENLDTVIFHLHPDDFYRLRVDMPMSTNVLILDGSYVEKNDTVPMGGCIVESRLRPLFYWLD